VRPQGRDEGDLGADYVLGAACTKRTHAEDSHLVSAIRVSTPAEIGRRFPLGLSPGREINPD
jgi:hypothetical protein